jgi:hypothetical protein
MNILKYKKFNESVSNLFEKDILTKKKYMNQVWDLLQDAYSEQGGIKGNGFSSPDDMLNIPFWKIDVVDDKVVAVFMYKFIDVNDIKIRKLIALGISRNNLDIGRLKLKNIMKKEFDRSIFETSLSFENYIIRNFPDEYNSYIFNVDDVKKILNKDIIVVDNHRYIRYIGDDYYAKVMLGTVKEKY